MKRKSFKYRLMIFVLAMAGFFIYGNDRYGWFKYIHVNVESESRRL